MSAAQPPSKTSPAPSTLDLKSLERLQRQSKKPKTTLKEPSPIPTMSTPLKELSGTEGALVLSRPIKRALDQVEQAIGGRDVFIDVISLASLDKKQEHFLRLLCDPIRRNDNLATIAHDAGILPTQVMGLFREASFAKAHAIAMGQLAEKVPAIVADLSAKAVDEIVTCPECLGTTDQGDEPCEKCHGRGTILRQGDLDHQKVALELSGLLKKGPGVNVQVQQNNISNSSPGAFFSKFVRASDHDAYDIEGEVVEVKSDGP